ncbi:MAG: HD-GYP domain-containing protein [Zoogloea sp.]|uniref:HD-GYP domain-containing protein n=1 Tax=Zoogloea sp. TaxID=49181 RepID=UPI00262E823D|nr:HD-GYP domain-containing protein [Zoogloea sp.]MDD3329272.1 HD-GYP domain-containing protein [Zoogloea sp.]
MLLAEDTGLGPFREGELREIVAAADLRIGMFVAELDRPWLESPFLMQGFVIEDDATLAQLRGLCRFVHVDRSRSVGDAWRAADESKPDSRLERTATLGSFQVPAGARRRPVDFFRLLRSLRSAGRGEDALGEAAQSPQEMAPWLHVYPDAAGHKGLAGVSEVEAPGYAARASSRPLITSEESQPRGASVRARTERTGGASTAAGFAYLEPTVALEEEIVTALPLVNRAHGLLAQIALDVQRSLNPDLERLRGVVSEMVLSVARNPDALLWLARLKQTDQYSYDHSLDVSAHVMIFGRYLGLGDESIGHLGMAGMLQDVGKLKLPPALLQKCGALSPREHEIFRSHVDFSLQILSKSPGVSLSILEIVTKHHERCDGSGYPRGLKGGQVGLMAEISGLCDTYCAMTRERPYGEAASAQVALDAVRAQRGVGFSESTVDQFVQCIGLYPVGSLVELNSGEVAVVVAQNRIRRLKPRVMILLGPDKKPNSYPHTLDLLYEQPTATGQPYAIVRALPPGAYGVDASEFYLT